MFTKIAESKWLKVILFITTFAFVGTGFVALIVYKLSGNINGAAKVNGKEIPFQEFFFTVNLISYSLEKQGIDTAALKNQIYTKALNEVIERELLFQFAEKEGLAATIEEAKEMIKNDKSFQTDGKFDQKKYEALLNRLNISPAIYLEIIRKELTAYHLYEILYSGTYITDYEYEKELNKAFERIYGTLYIIKPKIKITPKILKKVYKENKNKFIKNYQKKVAVYEFNALDEESIKKAQNLYKTIKSGEKPSQKPSFSGLENQLKNFPKNLRDAVKELNEKNKVKLVKTKGKIYLVVYLGKESKIKDFENVKKEVEKLAKERILQEKLKKLAKQLESENLSDKLLKEKFKAKQVKLDGTPLKDLQLFHNIQNIEVIRKTPVNSFTKPIITNGEIAIVRIDEKKPVSEEIKKDFKDFKKLLFAQKLNDEFKMLINKLKQEADIKINEQVFRQ